MRSPQAAARPSRRAKTQVFSLVSVCILAAVFMVGCSGGGGSSPTTPTPPNPPGGGTSTLLVVGSADAMDAGAGVFVTNFAVTVSDSLAAAVSGATVTIAGPFGTVTLVEDTLTAGTYTGTRNDYTPGNYALTVQSGSDLLDRATVVAPDIHGITSPATSDTVAADQTLTVTWSRTAAAQEAAVDTREFMSGPITDTGTFVVPASGNPPRLDQFVRVFRTNRMTPTDGLAGSSFRVTLRNSSEPVISRLAGLTVVADVNGLDVGGGLFITNFTAVLSDALLLPISGAAVSMTGPFGAVTLTEDPVVSGTYTAARADYTPGTYNLAVVSGIDQVTGVITAPDIHAITSPVANDTIAANQPIMVTWTRSAAAQEAQVETRSFTSVAMPDTLSFTVPASGNPIEPNQRFRVFRINRMTPTGGLGGSEFRANIRNSTEPVVAQ